MPRSGPTVSSYFALESVRMDSDLAKAVGRPTERWSGGRMRTFANNRVAGLHAPVLSPRTPVNTKHYQKMLVNNSLQSRRDV